MHLTAKGSESDLAVLKSDVLKHCTLMSEGTPEFEVTDYGVHLAAWNPNRQDWAEDRLCWWLELRKGDSELLPIKDGELKATAGGRGGVPLHFLDGLRELYAEIELSGYVIDLASDYGKNWKCSSEGTFCVEEVSSCWEGDIVFDWKKDGRMMIEHGKPVAEELLGYAGNPFVMVEGVPLSITLDAAKAHILKLAEEDGSYLERLLIFWSELDKTENRCVLAEDRCDDPTASAEDRFFATLRKLRLAQMMRKKTE